MDPLFLKDSYGEFNNALRRISKRNFSSVEGSKWRRLVAETSLKAGIPTSVCETTIQYYESHKSDLPRMRKRELAVALLYVFMKKSYMSHRSLKEISRDAGVDFWVTGKYVMQLGLEDGLKAAYRPPEDYVLVYASRIGADHSVTQRGMTLARVYRERILGASGPRTVAACALYLACRGNGHRRTQKEIANVFGIAEYTVREVSAKMKEFQESETTEANPIETNIRVTR